MGDELVHCHAGHAYPGRPLALRWEDKRLEVAEVLSEARTPLGKTFRVRVEDGRVFNLEYNEVEIRWEIREN